MNECCSLSEHLSKLSSSAPEIHILIVCPVSKCAPKHAERSSVRSFRDAQRTSIVVERGSQMCSSQPTGHNSVWRTEPKLGKQCCGTILRPTAPSSAVDPRSGRLKRMPDATRSRTIPILISHRRVYVYRDVRNTRAAGNVDTSNIKGLARAVHFIGCEEWQGLGTLDMFRFERKQCIVGARCGSTVHSTSVLLLLLHGD